MKRILFAILILAMCGEVRAQRWMQYNQMYPVGKNTSKMRLPNGTDQYFISDGHNYFDVDAGTWKRHTFQYTPLGDGKYMYEADYKFITGKFYSDEFIISNNNIWVSWTPIGANNVQVRIMGDTAFYNNVYTQVKAARVISSDGVKEYLRAGSNAATDSFEYVYRTNAAQIKKNGTYFLLYDGNGVMQLAVPKARYWDANGVERDGIYKWKRIQNGDYYVTMKVDYSGLTFPVIIDPTTSLTDTSKMKDGLVSSSTAATKITNYGADADVTILNQGADIRRMVRYWDLSSIASNTVLSYKDSINSTTNSYAGTGKNPANWGWAWYPLTRSFYETTFHWKRRNNTSADSLWVIEGIVPNSKNTSDIDTTYKAKFKSIKAGTSGWLPFIEDSARVSAIPLFNAWLQGTLANNGFVMMLDSTNSGYDSSSAAYYIQVTLETKEAATNKPRLWITGVSVSPCTLSVVDTNSVSCVIDTVNGAFGSGVGTTVSIYNATLGRYYAIDGNNRIRLVDTIYAATRDRWSDKRIPLKPNADNFLLTVTEVSGVVYDSTIQIQRVGNPSTISILDAGDTLFFRLYDNHGNFKWFRVDSLIQQSRMERYTYNSPVFAFALVDRWRE